MESHSYRLCNGVSCKIAPTLGCNLFSWVIDGKEVFYTDKEFGQDPLKFFYGGNPVLFPAVGRTWERSGKAPRFGIYKVHGFDGEYFMPLHGLLQSAQCRRTDEKISPDRVRVEYEVCIPETTRLKSYPFDLSLKIAYTLENNTLRLEAAITNLGRDVAPFSFGYHPWFATADPGRRGVSVRLPCACMRTIDPLLSVPDGGKSELSGVLHFQPDIGYDGVYSGLTGTRATMTDNTGGRRIHIDIDKNIADFVIASPEKTPAVCVEPWTAGLGAYETLASPDWQTEPSLELIQPGATRTVEIRYTVETLAE